MSIKAKVKVIMIMHSKGQSEVHLTPVTADSEENKSWSKYTPSGLIKFNITNPDAVAQFKIDQEYVVEFKEV